MDLASLLHSDDLFVHVSRRRWFGPRRLAVQGGGGLALVHDRTSRLQRIVGRICLAWLGLEPAELHIVPQGGGAALVVRRRMFPVLPRVFELTDAAGTVIATVRRNPWSLWSLDIRDRNDHRAGRIRGHLLSRVFTCYNDDERELGTLTGEGLGWTRSQQPGWRITRGSDASAAAMLLLLAAAFAVHLRWYDR